MKVKRTIPRPNQYIISEAVEGVLKAVKRKQVRVSPEANWNEEFKRIVTLVKIRCVQLWSSDTFSLGQDEKHLSVIFS